MPLIVLMEDDAATRMLVASVLKKDGYDVLSADNGADGLALVWEHKPVLVISDIQMPVMDGFSMLRKQQYPIGGRSGQPGCWQRRAPGTGRHRKPSATGTRRHERAVPRHTEPSASTSGAAMA